MINVPIEKKPHWNRFPFFNGICSRNATAQLSWSFGRGTWRGAWLKYSQKTTKEYGEARLHSASRTLCIYFSSSYVKFDPHYINWEKKSAGYDVDKDSDYWGMNMIWFKNIFRVSPLRMIPGSISNYDRSDPKNFKIRTKPRNLPQVLILEKIYLHVLQ